MEVGLEVDLRPLEVEAVALGGEVGRSGGNQRERRLGVIGVVMREWMMCVSGGASGEGKVGGSVLNARMSGGTILFTGSISSCQDNTDRTNNAPVQPLTPILPHDLALARS